MMICPNCNSQVEDNAAFCPNCGVAFYYPQNDVPPMPLAFGNDLPGQPVFASGASSSGQKKERNKKWIVIPVAAIIFILLSCIMLKVVRTLFQWSQTEAQATFHEQMPEDVDFSVRYQVDERNGDSTRIDALPETGTIYSQTIMIYMVGSNLESGDMSVGNPGGFASEDIEEILHSGADTVSNNILICTGGTSQWQSHQIPSDRVMVYRVAEEQLEEVGVLVDANMGDPGTLVAFLQEGISRFPAEKYGLVFWDHGAGPIFGCCYDEQFDNDELLLPELQAALKAALPQAGITLDWIGFDACLMGSVEVANALAPYARYLIASQETESSSGWNYSFLQALNEADMDAPQLAKHIIDTYVDTSPYGYAATLTCVDLGATDELATGLDKFFSEVSVSLTDAVFPRIVQARTGTKEFGKTTTDSYDLVDLKGFLIGLSGEYPSDAVLELMDKCVLYMRTNIAGVGGLSVYCPYTEQSFTAELLDGIYDMVSFSPSYSEFVRSFYEKACAGSNSSVKSPGRMRSDVFYSGEGQSDFMLTLTDEQLATFASASYVILKRDPWNENAKDEYIRVFYSVDTVLDGNRLFATYNDRATFLFDGDRYSELPLMMMERNAPVNGVHRYEYAGVLFFKKALESDPLESIVANVQFCVNEQTHEVTILNAVPVNNDGTEKPDVQHSRTQIDLSQIDTYEFVSNTYRLTRDKKGNVLPSNRWETAEDEVKVLGVGFNPAEGHRFIQRPLEKEERGNYYCQFLITDVYGNQYGTELIPFEN